MFVDVLGRLTVDGALANRIALVPYSLSFGERDLTLDQIVLQVHSRGDQRQTFLARTPHQFIDLPSMQQQFPLTQRSAVQVAAGRVGTDMAIHQPGFAIAHHCIRVLQVKFSFTN